MVEHRLALEPQKDAPYLILTGELWGTYCENLIIMWVYVLYVFGEKLMV